MPSNANTQLKVVERSLPTPNFIESEERKNRPPIRKVKQITRSIVLNFPSFLYPKFTSKEEHHFL